jgi:hypothetical protein
VKSNKGSKSYYPQQGSTVTLVTPRDLGRTWQYIAVYGIFL